MRAERQSREQHVDRWREAASDGDLSAGMILRILEDLQALRSLPAPWGQVPEFDWLIISCARPYSRRFGIPMEDLIQEGILAAVGALEMADPESGFERLGGYVWSRLRGEMASYVRRNRQAFGLLRDQQALDVEAPDLQMEIEAALGVQDGFEEAFPLEAEFAALAKALPHGLWASRGRAVVWAYHGLSGGGPMTLAEIGAAEASPVSRERVRHLVEKFYRELLLPLSRREAWESLWFKGARNQEPPLARRCQRACGCHRPIHGRLRALCRRCSVNHQAEAVRDPAARPVEPTPSDAATGESAERQVRVILTVCRCECGCGRRTRAREDDPSPRCRACHMGLCRTRRGRRGAGGGGSRGPSQPRAAVVLHPGKEAATLPRRMPPVSGPMVSVEVRLDWQVYECLDDGRMAPGVVGEALRAQVPEQLLLVGKMLAGQRADQFGTMQISLSVEANVFAEAERQALRYSTPGSDLTPGELIGIRLLFWATRQGNWPLQEAGAR